MSIYDRLKYKMPHSVQIFPRAGEVDGTPQYGSGVTFAPCQVLEGPVRVRDRSGDLIIYSAQIIGPLEPEVLGDSRVSLPSGNLGTVGNVRIYPDAQGNAFQVVYLK